MLKVLIIGYVWPEPQSSGAGVRMMQLIHLFLEQAWQITFASPAAKTEHMLDLEALGVQTSEIQLNHDGFDTFIADLEPNIVLFDRFMMEEQFAWRVEKHCPAALRMIETVDLHLLRDARHQALKQQRKLETSDLYSDIAKREIASIYRSDLSILISEFELHLLQDTFNMDAKLLHLCPFMFADKDIAHPLPNYDQRQHFITIGNFRHAPNWDAVLWLKQKIWPLIRQSIPQAELHIYGSYTPKKATDLHNPKEGFYIQGWVKDACEVMKSARICLAPLRFGAGIKGKLADAMLSGTPSISTAIGAESMSGGLAWGGQIGDDAESFAQHAIALYQDQKQWQQAQNNGFSIVQKLFNKENNGTALIECLQDHLDHLETYRLHNFTGSMLRHHHHRSTEFMSRWIALKNTTQDKL